MSDPLVFILTAEESFTPSRSGAIATHTHACCRQAAAAGVQTLVLARPNPQAPAYDDVESLLYEAPEAPSGGPALMVRRAERRARQWTRLRFGEYAEQTVRAIRDRRLDEATLVVHNDPELVVAMRRRLPRAKLVHWFHNQHRCKPRPTAAFADSADHSIAVSDFIRDWAMAQYNLPPHAIDRVYNGVDLEMFQPSEQPASNERPIINFTGRTGIEKAPDLVLAAALELTDRGVVEFGVQIIGANHWGERTMDDYQRRLDDLAGRLRERGVAVDMTGHLDRSKAAARMPRADIHVTPSRWDEPFGLTTVEAMACGLATVGSRT
ncbi:MAG: glycosyltransferase, partial [Alphaproteobacteria bacterium]|nr:glycosyltransferase [Alphaproteobacteria bacterium]